MHQSGLHWRCSELLDSPRDSAPRSCATTAGAPTDVPPGVVGGPLPSRLPGGMVARASVQEILEWLDLRVLRFLADNPNAVDVHGDCPRGLRWPALLAQIGQHFGQISDTLAEVIKNRIFELLLDHINLAFYLSADPRGFNLGAFVRTLRDDFDLTKTTVIPSFDIRGNRLPPRLHDEEHRRRCERRPLCGTARDLWEQICNHVERQFASMDLKVPGGAGTWSNWGNIRRDLEDLFGPMDEQTAADAKSFCTDVFCIIHNPPKPSSKLAPRSSRRSRRENAAMREWVDSDSAFITECTLDLSEDDGMLVPSAFEERGWCD